MSLFRSITTGLRSLFRQEQDDRELKLDVVFANAGTYGRTPTGSADETIFLRT